MFHSAFGCFLVEKVFGINLTNSEGRKVSTRDLAEEHIIEDLGFIPTLEHWLRNMTEQPWMFGARRDASKSSKFIKID